MEDSKIVKRGEMKHHHWHIRNIIILIAGIILAYYILTSSDVESFILGLDKLSYLGALIIGLFWGLGFTTVPATAALLMLGQNTNFILIGIIGGFGATLSNFIIFHWIRSNRDPDLRYIIRKTHLNSIRKLEKTRLHWIVPLFAGLIFISPLPDEVGDFIFGVYHYKTLKFLILSWILSSIGVGIIAFAGST